MQDRTINSALLALRKQIIRENRNGLEAVEALLRQRRVKLPPVPRAPRRTFRRGQLRREVAAMLRERPRPRSGIAAHLQEAHGFTHRRADACYYSRLGRPGIAPERLLRALLQCLYSVRSERQLMERLDFDLLLDALDGLHREGIIFDPVGKPKSVMLTDEGLQRSRESFEALFAKGSNG